MTAEELISSLVETGWVERPASEVIAVIHKAVAAEREACAKIADEKISGLMDKDSYAAACVAEDIRSRSTLACIAEEIRARGNE